MSAYWIVTRPERDQLGETAFWDAATGRLYWRDIVGRMVKRLDPAAKRIERWSLPQGVGGVAPTADEAVLVTLGGGVDRLSSTSARRGEGRRTSRRTPWTGRCSRWMSK